MRSMIRTVLRFFYRVIATLFAKVSWVTRVVAVLSPHFFLYFRGEGTAAMAPLAPELNFYRLMLAVLLSVLFTLYFIWDALVVAGRPSKSRPHLTGEDWDQTKAAMDDNDASMMGSSAWMKQRARQTDTHVP